MEPAPAAVIAELQAEYDAAVQRVLGANPDWATGILRDDLSVYYDDEDDLAIVLFGPLTDCVMLELDDWIWVRLDPQTDRIIGLEFPHALAQRAAAIAPVQIMLDAIVALTAEHRGDFLTAPPEIRAALAAEARELVLV